MQGLTKRFGDRLAVDGITLSVARGELFGLLGPNGAGKTTTIKLLAGLLRPSAGRAALCGYDVVTQSLRSRALAGYVPDQPALYDKLTGREMLALAAELYGVPREEHMRRAGPMLETFNLSDQGDELVQSYSRGMRQKLGLCCALIHDPEVLMLDEPTVGLDPAGARQLKDVVRHLTSLGRTVVLSTHVLEVAELLCDRVAIVQAGRLVAVDTPAALRAKSGEGSLEDAFLRITSGVVDQHESLRPLLQALDG